VHSAIGGAGAKFTRTRKPKINPKRTRITGRVWGDRPNIFVAIFDDNAYVLVVNAGELKRLLAKQGCTFESHKGGSGHLLSSTEKERSNFRCMAARRNWVHRL
jgi:hypothetical protein